MIMARLCFLAIILLLAGCRTGGVILRETPSSLSETRRVVVGIIGEPRDMSRNGRELISHYFDKKNKRIEKPDSVQERYFAMITILGDRRPYDVQVEVFVQTREDGEEFSSPDRDDDRAATMAEKIRQSLNQSRDTRNVIDDFRSF